MKRLLSILIGVLMVSSLFLFSNTLFAQEEVKGIITSRACINGMGKDCFQYEKIIGIQKYQKGDYTALSIIQDVVLASTYMVGTVLTIVIIRCGFGYILASRGGQESKAGAYKKGLISAAIGAVIVMGAYALVRLIQYVSRG